MVSVDIKLHVSNIIKVFYFARRSACDLGGNPKECGVPAVLILLRLGFARYSVMAGTPEKMLEYLLETHMDNRSEETPGMYCLTSNHPSVWFC